MNIPSPKSRFDAMVGFICLFISFIILAVIIPNYVPQETAAIWTGHPLYQRPDLIPRIWSIIMLLSSLFLLIQSFFIENLNVKEEEIDNYKIFFKNNLVKIKKYYIPVLIYLLILIIFIRIFPIIGFWPSGILFLIFGMIWFGYKDYIKVVLFSIIGGTAIYLLLANVLGVIFP